MTTQITDLTDILKPYFKQIKRAVDELESCFDEYGTMIPFDIDEEYADALRWLQDNIFV